MAEPFRTIDTCTASQDEDQIGIELKIARDSSCLAGVESPKEHFSFLQSTKTLVHRIAINYEKHT
jgi:hypothetical protein